MDLNAMMNLVKNMQGAFPSIGSDIKEKLSALIVNISVGGGAVCLQMNGLYEILQLDIQTDIIAPQEKIMLQDLLILAFNQGSKDIKAKQKQLFSSLGLPVDMLEGLL